MPASSPRASLGQIVRARRVALGLSQEMLATRVSDLGSEITQADISRIELGKVELPRRRRLEHLAVALEVSLGELLEASGWVGAVQTFAETPPPGFSPRASSAPVSPTLGERAQSDQPSIMWVAPNAPASSTAMDALLRLRMAISRAHEPVARAAELLHDCQETAERWDPGLARTQATPPRAQASSINSR